MQLEEFPSAGLSGDTYEFPTSLYSSVDLSDVQPDLFTPGKLWMNAAYS